MTFGRRTADASPALRLVPNVGTPQGAADEAQDRANRSQDPASGWINEAHNTLLPIVRDKIPAQEAKSITRGALAARINEIAQAWIQEKQHKPDPAQERDLVTALTNSLLGTGKAAPIPVAQQAVEPTRSPTVDLIEEAKERIQPKLLSRIDVSAASALPRAELAREISEVVAEIAIEERIQLNSVEQRN